MNPTAPGWWQGPDGQWNPPSRQEEQTQATVHTQPSEADRGASETPSPTPQPTLSGSMTPQGEGWWQASDGRWYSPDQHPALSESDAVAYLNSLSVRDRKLLAKNPHGHPVLLATMVLDPDPNVRQLLARNPATSAATLRRLIMDANHMVRFSADRSLVGREPSQAGERPLAMLGPFTVLNGAGWAPQIGTSGMLQVYGDRVELGTHRAVSIVPHRSLRDLQCVSRQFHPGRIAAVCCSTVLFPHHSWLQVWEPDTASRSQII